MNSLPPRVHSLPAVIQSTRFFEYFLPLIAILGDIINLHHRQNHPRFNGLNESQKVAVILNRLDKCGVSLVKMAGDSGLRRSSALDAYASSNVEGPPSPMSGSQVILSADLHPEAVTKTQLVIAYSTHILHILYVLLHGK